MLKRFTGVAAVLLLGALALSGCSSVPDPDKVGLYYDMGSSDGYKFETCIDPGATGDAEWNNEVIYLPTSLRTWNIAPEGGDSNTATIVSTKPEDGQPSGVQVKVWSTTSFYLNTYCGNDGGVVRPFWEKIGRRYAADTDAGWRTMLVQTLIPALDKTTQDIVRSYGADELVGNIGGVRAEAQTKISAAITTELNRLTGGDFFCGPTFVRTSAACPQIEIVIRDVDYADDGIQQARNEKQKAVELAAAKVAEAQGQVDAAKKLNGLYRDEAWVELQLAQIELEKAKACAASSTCILIQGGSPNINLSTK